MNPERAAMNSIDRSRERRIELSPILERASERAAEVLSDPDYVIQESEFAGVYDERTIENDIALADRLARQFDARMTSAERNTKKIADTFEAVVLMQTEMGEWLGSEATTLKTARFDDFTNKVDMVVEWNSQEGSRVLALAVDVTFGKGTVEKKLSEIRHEIDKGELGSIRYFRDQAGNFMGTRRNVARTVVGISQPVVEELAGLWLENKNKALGEHPIQRVLLDQIGFQLTSMQKYALALGKYELARAYDEGLGAIQKVRVQKQGVDASSLREDPVRREIVEQTKLQFGTR